MCKTEKTNIYPDSLKNQPKSKVILKPNGKPYRWGTVMPLIGGFPLGAAKATGVKPQFIASWPAFKGNDQHIMEYWDDVPLIAINDEMKAESYELQDGDEDDSILNRYAEPINEDLFKDLDFVVSVPLCSGLSTLNASKSITARGSDAEQNKWIYETARFALEYIKPRAFVGENAPGLFTKIGEGVVENLQLMAKEFGYHLVLYKTNTVKHGIPQSRHRTFYLFFRDSLPKLELINKGCPSLEEFLKEIPEWADYQDHFNGTSDIKTNPLTNFIASNRKDYPGKYWHSDLVGNVTDIIIDKFSLEEACEWIADNYTDKKSLGSIRFLKHVQKKIDMGKGWWDLNHLFLSDRTNAITGKTTSSLVHPNGERTFNTRELAWLMGLPHDFKIMNEEYHHLTQNVPVNTAADIITQLIKGIDGDLPKEPGNFLKINNDFGTANLKSTPPILFKKLF